MDSIREQFPLLANLKDYSWDEAEVLAAKSHAAILKDQWITRNREISSHKVELPEGMYRVIYADPPWDYGSSCFGEATATRAETYYPTMPTEDICKMALPTNPII